jgi:hypothetical protein
VDIFKVRSIPDAIFATIRELQVIREDSE